MPHASGSRLGPYELVAPIGAGGMGEVWRAKDTRLDRSVAVKILPAGFAEDEERRTRFEREAKAISSLSHPHVCTLFDVGRESGAQFLVMELLEGESLADRLLKGPLPLEQVTKLGAQLAEALDAAHRQGVVHRDLKPGNVMLTKAGAKLLDFGLARSNAALGGPSGSTEMPTEAKPLTTAGTVLGTFQYMAPEQLEGAEADARTDIFALGALVYEMATAKRAFEGRSKTSLIAAILQSQPRPISEIVPLMPPGLDHVVRKCLEKDPDDRWQSARDVASELRFVAEAGSQAGAPATRGLRRRSRERLAWALVAALALAALALGIAALRRDAAPLRAYRATLEPPPDTSVVPFDELGLALSPDGRQLAFVGLARDGSKQIWVRDLAQMSARPLPETAGAWYPFWSPDGRHLGFFADGKLKRIDLRGGAPQAVADAPSGRGGSWGRGDTILFTPSTASGIHRVAATGGAATAVTRVDPKREPSHYWPHLLPDGRRFLYVQRLRGSGRAARGNLVMGSLDSQDAKLLVEDATNAVYVEPGYLIYGRAGTLYARRFDAGKGELDGEPVPIVEERLSSWEPKDLMVFAASGSGALVYLPEGLPKTTLQWHDDAGRALGALGPPAYHVTPRISPDGRKVVYVLAQTGLAQNSRASDLWIADLQYQRAFRLTQKSGTFQFPVWSRDSSRLAFGCQPGGVQDLCTISLGAGGEVETLVESPSWKDPGSFAPDGRSLLYAEQDPETGWDLKLLGLDGKRDQRFLLRTPGHERLPEISPDGRWVAYRTDETGRFEVALRSLGSGFEQWQVSTAGGSQPRWRGDGRELYYVASDGYLMAVSIQTQPVFRPGTPRRLFLLPERPARDAPVFEDVTADGKRFLLNVPVQALSSVGFHLVVNWRALLDARGD